MFADLKSIGAVLSALVAGSVNVYGCVAVIVVAVVWAYVAIQNKKREANADVEKAKIVANAELNTELIKAAAQIRLKQQDQTTLLAVVKQVKDRDHSEVECGDSKVVVGPVPSPESSSPAPKCKKGGKAGAPASG